ncbi:MAG TPA: XdhC/CoxI family protein [Chloroflexi bacterium]|nr:XdhC/CoxI family protein [Chloroflexota bacterium]
MRELLTDLTRWLTSGVPIALATVIWAEGPSLRPVGSHMAVSGSGQIAGSVSGGCVEGAVFQEVQEVLSGGPPKRLRYTTVDEDGWEVGLPCGGTIEVYLEPLAPAHERLLVAIKADETVALVTRLDGGGHLLAWPDGRMEGDTTLAPEVKGAFPGPQAERRSYPDGDRFVQVFIPPPTITVVGAVHLAQPLVRLAQVLGFRVRVVDGRRLFATRERFPTVDELVVAWPQEALGSDRLRPQDAVVILSHDPKFDLPALETALRSPVGYIGLLGSRTTQAKRRAALAERGFTEEEMARIHGPVGLDLGGREPGEIGLAILAEIVATRHGQPATGN